MHSKQLFCVSVQLDIELGSVTSMWHCSYQLSACMHFLPGTVHVGWAGTCAKVLKHCILRDASQEMHLVSLCFDH